MRWLVDIQSNNPHVYKGQRLSLWLALLEKQHKFIEWNWLVHNPLDSWDIPGAYKLKHKVVISSLYSPQELSDIWHWKLSFVAPNTHQLEHPKPRICKSSLMKSSHKWFSFTYPINLSCLSNQASVGVNQQNGLQNIIETRQLAISYNNTRIYTHSSTLTLDPNLQYSTLKPNI